MNPIMRNSLLLIGLMLTLLASAPPQHVAAQPSDIPLVLQWSSTESDHTRSVAWGDVDGDGDLALHLEPGSLPGAETFLVVMPPGAVPGPLPAGRVLVGDPYDVTALGALVTLEKPAILKLHYDEALVPGAPAGLGIYRWDPNTDQWKWVSGRIDVEQAAVVASVRVLGTYALLAPAGLPPTQRVLLPLVLKDLR